MSGYTKLFQSILDSTIWQESSETRLLWITMLAMSDKNGEVQASIPGLAKRAGITIQECEDGLKTLLSPDPYSRTPDYEGRRIEVIGGGWSLLNHAKYRDLMSYEERKEYNRRKQAEHRAKKAQESAENVNDMSITVNHSQSQSAMSAHNKRQKAKANTKAKEEDPLTPKGELLFPSDFSKEDKTVNTPKASKAKPESQSELNSYFLEVGLTQGDAEYAWNHWESKGWKNGRDTIKDWKAAVRSWKAAGYWPSQKDGPRNPVEPQKQRRPLPSNWREIAQDIYGHPVTCPEEDLTPSQWADIYRQTKK